MDQFFDLCDLDVDLISEQQAGDLEIEVNIEVMEVLRDYAAKKEKYVEDVLFNDPPVYEPTNVELSNGRQTFPDSFWAYLEGIGRVEDVVEIQEEMAKLSHRIYTGKKWVNVGNDCEKAVKNNGGDLSVRLQSAIDSINDWYNRFNTWLNTAEYRKYGNKSKAWEIYKLGLARRKSEIKLLRSDVAEYAKRWKELQERCSEIATGYDWFQYFRLEECDPYEEWAAVDPEDVDNQYVVTVGFEEAKAVAQGEASEVLRDTYLSEMEEYERDGRIGRLWGFWNYKEEMAIRRQEINNDYYDQLEYSCG